MERIPLLTCLVGAIVGAMLLADDGAAGYADCFFDVEKYGAGRDAEGDDTAAIQTAIDAAAAEGGIVFFPPGTYRLTAALIPRANIYMGVPGSSMLTQTTRSAAIFESSEGFASRTFSGLTLKAAAVDVAGFKVADPAKYMSYSTWTDCEFYQDLQYGIWGNLIFASIQNCRFGYLGNTNRQGVHTALHIRGSYSPAKSSNINYVQGSQFFSAEGGNAAVDIQTNACDWTFASCDFEGVKTACVYAKGVYILTFRDCWFEPRKSTGSGAAYMVYAGTDGTQGTRPVTFQNCWITTASASDITHVVEFGAASLGVFVGCHGNLRSGYLSRKRGLYDEGITSLRDNYLLGYAGALNQQHFVGQSQQPDMVTLAPGDTAPSVTAGSTFMTANTVPTTIQTFRDGQPGQQIFVVIDPNTTVDFSDTNLKGNEGLDFTGRGLLIGVYDGTDWNCIVQK